MPGKVVVGGGSGDIGNGGKAMVLIQATCINHILISYTCEKLSARCG